MAHSEINDKMRKKVKRGQRVRKHIRKFANRLRLSVNKTNKHLGVQLIDDEQGITLAGVATNSKQFRNTEYNKRSRAAARKLGELIAKMAEEKGIKEVVLDRGASCYHGLIGELADAAREGGLQF